jgi:hypothetical protein
MLCRTCSTELRAALTFAAAIAPDLADAVAKFTVRGSGGGSRRVPASQPPLDLDAAAIADELRNCLAGWCRALLGVHPGPPWPVNTTGGMARWLAERTGLIRQAEWAAAMHRDVLHHAGRALAAVDRRPDARLYAGPCPSCGADLLGQPGDAVIACRCGMVSEVDERHEAMRAVLEDQLGSVSWCASMASALGVAVTENTVKSWVQRERLVSHGERVSVSNRKAYAVYRFGDVLDLAAMRVRVRGLRPWPMDHQVAIPRGRKSTTCAICPTRPWMRRQVLLLPSSTRTGNGSKSLP